MNLEQKLKETIRDIPDFPKPGILFKDITPIFHNPNLCKEITSALVEKVKPYKPDAIVGIESRGFLFGFTMALEMNIPFILVRKSGKLPYQKHSFEYVLEYGSAIIEMHVDSIKPGWKVIVHDDLLATGGTAAAASELVKMQGGEVAAFAFLVELEFLKGQSNLFPHSKEICSLIKY